MTSPQDPWAEHSYSLGQYPSPVAPEPARKWPGWLMPALLSFIVTLALGGGVIWYAFTRSTDVVTAPPTTVPAAAKKAPPASGGIYTEPEELAAAIKRAGETCAGLGPSELGESGTRRAARCEDGDGEWVILATMTLGEAEREFAAASEMGIEGRSMLVGENWTIVGRHAFVERLHAALGGRVANGPVPG